MDKITIPAPSKTYDVMIGRGALSRAGEYLLKVVPPAKAVVVADDIVHSLYADPVCQSLERAGYRVLKYVFPHGEAQKNLTRAGELLDFLAQNNVNSADVLIALGGGVTGDLTGFCAAVYLRGIRFIQIPTTFLSAIDSSVGGKTGVNLPSGKNLAGAFYQPELVLLDPETFSTLPKGAWKDGVSEAVKYGAIADEPLFRLIAGGGLGENLESVIVRCIEIKRDVVSCDERDRGRRRILNFGHTIGHAIEQRSGYEISHGRAVAVGMAMVSKAADRLQLSKEPCAGRIKAALTACGLPAEPPFDAGELIFYMQNDKKRSANTLNLAILNKIGDCDIYPLALFDLPDFINAAY